MYSLDFKGVCFKIKNCKHLESIAFSNGDRKRCNRARDVYFDYNDNHLATPVSPSLLQVFDIEKNSR